ncbi:MAG: DUF1249 domain-containing protein [Gammaproteobacteria bacterium]|nr:DUF1249 domain-containing protein [Gammaproteobacteria bacterium]
MTVTSSDIGCVYCGRRPVRIAALLELYERNYRLVQQLVPELNLPFDRAVSHSATDLPLHLITLERSRYTATFRLTYEFACDDGMRQEPDIWLRVYRDAHVVEALRCAARPPWLADGEADPQVDTFLTDQWNRNVMLHKWLQYLLHHGHGFGMAARPRALVPV